VELSPTQVRAIEILIKKTLPDLQAVDLSGMIEAAVTVSGALAWKPPQ
jgi:hypothetical protein